MGIKKWDPKNFEKKILKNCSGRQMPPRGYWGIKCHTGVLGRQMPHDGIGASNATLNLLGEHITHLHTSDIVTFETDITDT